MLATTMACWSCPATLLRLIHTNPTLQSSIKSTNLKPLIVINSSISTTSFTSISWSETEQESEEEEEEEYTEDEEEEEEDGGSSAAAAAAMTGHAPPVRMRRRRYRKEYPGEKKGITEEMRFVTMKLRNRGKPKAKGKKNNGVDGNGGKELSEVNDAKNCDNGSTGGESWEPSVEGFLKYLVDSKLVFSTLENIVDESSDVSYAYFRKTGLERSESLSKDLEWFSQQGNSIPEPSNPGITYAKYLEELAENSPPLFMSHFYNIHFSHIAGGQVIAKKVTKNLIQGKELEFFKWERNEEELLRETREKLNMLGEHWSRDETNKCLREATKAFRYLGQIVRLIIL